MIDRCAKYFIFKVGGKFFGTPLENLKKVIPLEEIYPVPLMDENFVGLIRFEGGVVPLLDTGKALGMGRGRITRDSLVAVKKTKAGDIGFLIDRAVRIDTLSPGLFVEIEEEMTGVREKAEWEERDLFLLHEEEIIRGIMQRGRSIP